jgi:hypothetical protein
VRQIPLAEAVAGLRVPFPGAFMDAVKRRLTHAVSGMKSQRVPTGGRSARSSRSLRGW